MRRMFVRMSRSQGFDRRWSRRWSVAVLALVLLAAACGSPSTDDDGDGDGTDSSAEASESPGDGDNDGDNDADGDDDGDDDDGEDHDRKDTDPAGHDGDDDDGDTDGDKEEAHEDENACGSDLRPTSEIVQLVSGGNTYQYSIFIPPGYDGSPLPLVLNFHGLGGNGTQQSNSTRYIDLAEEENFIVVHPSGLRDPNLFLPSWELPVFDTDARDDVAFVLDLLRDIKRVACIDNQRIYATGLSNGGFFSAVIACELSDTFAAVFSVAGITHAESCRPSNPIAIGAIHGTADEVVTYLGEGSTLLGALGSVVSAEVLAAGREFFDRVIPDEVGEFAADMGCDQIADTAHSADTTLRTYSGCDDPNVEVRLYTVEGGGHVWPGARSAQGQSTADFDATRDGWAFMSQFTLVGRS